MKLNTVVTLFAALILVGILPAQENVNNPVSLRYEGEMNGVFTAVEWTHLDKAILPSDGTVSAPLYLKINELIGDRKGRLTGEMVTLTLKGKGEAVLHLKSLKGETTQPIVLDGTMTMVFAWRKGNGTPQTVTITQHEVVVAMIELNRGVPVRMLEPPVSAKIQTSYKSWGPPEASVLAGASENLVQYQLLGRQTLGR